MWLCWRCKRFKLLHTGLKAVLLEPGQCLLPECGGGQALCGLRGVPAFRVHKSSQHYTGLQDHVFHREAHRPVNNISDGLIHIWEGHNTITLCFFLKLTGVTVITADRNIHHNCSLSEMAGNFTRLPRYRKNSWLNFEVSWVYVAQQSTEWRWSLKLEIGMIVDTYFPAAPKLTDTGRQCDSAKDSKPWTNRATATH